MPLDGQCQWRTFSPALSPSRRRHSSPPTVSTPTAFIDRPSSPGEAKDPPGATAAAGSGSTSWKNGSRSLVASRAAAHGRSDAPDGVSQLVSAKDVPRFASASANAGRSDSSRSRPSSR